MNQILEDSRCGICGGRLERVAVHKVARKLQLGFSPIAEGLITSATDRCIGQCGQEIKWETQTTSPFYEEMTV